MTVMVIGKWSENPRDKSHTRLFVAAGGTGEQMIVVLDGTRDAPGA
jgi:hypothetical protein